MLAVILLSAMALMFGLVLGYAAKRFQVEGDPVVDKIDAILPQTQCGQCGYPGCRPYAEAIANEDADINQCPPGGHAGVVALADLLGREPKPLAVAATKDTERTLVAVIDESTCIGCTKCIQVCPVDAIVGAAKHKHTVIEEHCTGCKLCLAPVCPVQHCIVMVEPAATLDTWIAPFPEQFNR